MNTFVSTKLSLKEAISNEKNRVVSFSGPWGGGKTFLLSEFVEENIKEELFKGSYYTSLIGVGSLDEFKKKIISLAWSKLTGKVPRMKAISNNNFVAIASSLAGKTGIGFFKKITGHSLSDSIITELPRILSDKLVFIDDIERKQDNLSITELLGFINEFSEMYGTRFVLVMNEDELKDIDDWKLYFEKIVDSRVVLRPSAKEIADIPDDNSGRIYIDPAKVAIESIGVSSIRIVDQIYQLLHCLFMDKVIESDDFYHLIVPGCVLLAAINLRGIESDISREYVLGRISKSCQSEQNRIELYDQMLSRLGINSRSYFYDVVINYIDYGIIDHKGVDKVLTWHRKESGNKEFRSDFESFVLNAKWGVNQDIDSLIKVASELGRSCFRMSAVDVSFLAKEIDRLGDSILSIEIVDDWINNYIDNLTPGVRYVSLNFYGDAELHPRIKMMDERLISEGLARPSLADLTKKINFGDGYNNHDSEMLKAYRVNDYISAITSIDSNVLSDFFDANFAHKDYKGDKDREIAFGKFQEACRIVSRTYKTGRLVEIIKREFSIRNIDFEQSDIA